MLPENQSPPSVFVFCGSGYDDFCGGYLPSKGDHEAHKYLTELFSDSNKGGLRDLVLTPIALTANEGKVLFTKAEVGLMVDRILQDAGAHVERLIIMTFNLRLCSDSAKAKSSNQHHSLYAADSVLEWAKAHNRKPTLLVAWAAEDRRPVAEQVACIKALKDMGFDVHFQTAAYRWEHIE
jgi:hypothetical protein